MIKGRKHPYNKVRFGSGSRSFSWSMNRFWFWSGSRSFPGSRSGSGYIGRFYCGS